MEQKNEKVLKEATLVLLIKDGMVWLARKTRYIGAGLLNTYGGGVEESDASPEACAIRELFDECGVIVSPLHMQKRSIVFFHNEKTDKTVTVCKMHVYVAHVFVETPHEVVDPKTGEIEMRDPAQYPIDDLPYDQMMPADRFWMSHVLAGKTIIAEAHYTPFQKELVGDVIITPVTEEELKKI